MLIAFAVRSVVPTFVLKSNNFMFAIENTIITATRASPLARIIGCLTLDLINNTDNIDTRTNKMIIP